MLTSEKVLMVMAGLVMATHAQVPVDPSSWWATPDKLWILGEGGNSCDGTCQAAGALCTAENGRAMRFAALSPTMMNIFMGNGNFAKLCKGSAIGGSSTNDVPFLWDGQGCKYGREMQGTQTHCSTRPHDRRARRVCQCTKTEEGDDKGMSDERKKLMDHIDRNVISREFSEDRWGMCYIGCFKDDRSRDLDTLVPGSHNVDTCRRECSKKNFTYFSVQYGTECRCGNNYATQGKYHRLDDSKCQRGGYPAGQGGAWANSVYKTACSDECALYNGIPHPDGKTCCHHTCGKYCGNEAHCNLAEAGSEACCASGIAENELCEGQEETPCRLSEKQGAKLCTGKDLDGTCCEVGPGKFQMVPSECNIPDNSLNSVEVSEQCHVKLYEHYQFWGQSWGLSPSRNNLIRPGFFSSCTSDIRCFTNLRAFQHNTVSSFEVTCDRRGTD